MSRLIRKAPTKDIVQSKFASANVIQIIARIPSNFRGVVAGLLDH
jgi:hypothetical protein